MKIERSHERVFVFNSGTRITVGYDATPGNYYASILRITPRSYLNCYGESGRHCIQKLRQEIVNQTLRRMDGDKDSGLYGGVKNLGVSPGAGGAGGIANSAGGVHGVVGTVIKYGRTL